jgi:hexosaminidase
MAMLALLLAVLQPSPIDFTVNQGTGLHLSVHGVPVIRGSWFQYYEPGWTKGYYSQAHNPQAIEKRANGEVVMTFSGADGLVSGSQRYIPTPRGLRVEYEYRWSGEKPVLVEMAAGMLWAPAFEMGTLKVDDVASRSLRDTKYPTFSIDTRGYGTGRQFQFDAPLALVAAKGSEHPWVLFDGRRYNQEWSIGRDLWWFGLLALEVKPGEPRKVEVEWEFEPRELEQPKIHEADWTPSASTDALLPPKGAPVPLVPEPKKFERGAGRVEFELSAAPTSADLFGTLRQALDRLWVLEGLPPVQKDFELNVRISDIGLPPQGYRIQAKPGSIDIQGQDDEGLRHAMNTLALLVYADNGRLYVPECTIEDWPSVDWRGVHLFVGPQALRFHDRLFSRVLVPLKFNKAVIQCERTDWLAQPGIRTDMTMSRGDLQAEFEMLRAMGVEPIPLIQSWGHMGWIFANQQNLDIAFSRDPLFSVDVTNPRTREVLTAIWNEAIALLKPKTIHFGLDEVDMRGWPDDPEKVSQHWEMHLPWLGELAKRHGVEMMLWSDKGLAPGEAVDATHGHTKEHAKRRRDAIPRGAYIADWHYRADARPEPFLTSLRLWKEEGFRPIASTWFRPENIRGFNLAAVQEGAGTLQTTWAGYESNEENMLRAFHQFSAMVLSADYAWSGRETLLADLEYDPMDVFRRLLYGHRSVASPVRGLKLDPMGARTARVGDLSFLIAKNPLALHSMIMPPNASGTTHAPASTLELPFEAEATEIALAWDTQVKVEESEVVAHLTINLADGEVVRQPVIYGRHVRAPGDERPAYFGERSEGLTAFRLRLGERPVKVTGLTFESRSPYAGLRLHGVTLL